MLFEGLLVWFRHTFGGVDFRLIWANPHWPMWYLSALFFWRLSTPLFKRMPAKVVVAVAISLVAGLYANNIFDNARILGLLPFFVLGLKMHEGHWNMLRTRRARWYGIAVLLVIFVVARFADTWLETEWYYCRTRYDVLDHDNLAGDHRSGCACCSSAWSAPSRSSRSCHAPRPGSPRWAGPPSWSTCSTGSSCSVRSSPGPRSGPPATGRSPWW